MTTARKAFKYRLYPTHRQETVLEGQMSVCRELYNAALQERREAYRMCGKQITYFDQANQLKDIRTFRPDLCAVNFSACQDVLRRLDQAFKAFFARVKRGDTPGFPRFQGRNRYQSSTWPSYGDGCKLKASGLVYLQGIGNVRFKEHRPIQGHIKTVTIRRDGNGWYVCVSCQYEAEVPPRHDGPVVGIDVGLEQFATLSTGMQIENPRYFRTSEKRLAKAQRKRDRVKHLPKTDPSKRTARKAVVCAHQHIRNQRQDFLHKQSRLLAATSRLIVVEAIPVKNLTRRATPVQDEQTGHYLPNGARAKSGLAKSIQDAGWSTFIKMLSYKAEEAGSKLLKVNPRGTSQTCPECGARAKKALAERWHSCPCGCELHRDVAAARVILSRGLATLEYPIGRSRRSLGDGVVTLEAGIGMVTIR